MPHHTTKPPGIREISGIKKRTETEPLLRPAPGAPHPAIVAAAPEVAAVTAVAAEEPQKLENPT